MTAHTKFISLTTLIACLTMSAGAYSLNYSADVGSANWQVSASPFECRVEQGIPEMGVASFYRRAGELLKFELQASSELPLKEQVSISLVAPQWNDFLTGRELERFSPSSDKRVRFDEQLADKMLQGLLFGYAAEFRDHGKNAQKLDTVAISPVRLRPAYREFQDCMAQLLPYNFDQISRTKINFISGQEILSEQHREHLRDVANYIKADKEVNAIFVDGYTDNTGDKTENLELSRQRAEQVALYLIHQGIDPDQIALRYHGDFYPLAPNNNRANRALNRRVTVRLDKVPEDSVRDKLYSAMVRKEGVSEKSGDALGTAQP